MNLKEIHEKIDDLLQENNAKGIWIIEQNKKHGSGQSSCSFIEILGFLEFLKIDMISLQQRQTFEGMAGMTIEEIFKQLKENKEGEK